MALLVGTLIGLVLGLTGAGGSVFAVPLLVLLVGLPMGEAVGLALGAVTASAFYGSVRNSSQRLVLWLPALLLGIGGTIFVPAGKYLGNYVPELWLLLGFNILATTLALRMWLGARAHPEQARVLRLKARCRLEESSADTNLCRLESRGQVKLRSLGACHLVIGGAVIGLISGLFGVGAGFLIVPLLLTLSQVTMAQAVATSLVIITAISGTGFTTHLLLNSATKDFTLLSQTIAGGVIGMILGQLVSNRVDGAKLQQVFAIGLILVSVASVVQRMVTS